MKDARCRTQDAGGKSQEAGGKTQKAGRTTQDAKGRTQEAGGKMQDAGGRGQEEGRKVLSSEFGNAVGQIGQSSPATSLEEWGREMGDGAQRNGPVRGREFVRSLSKRRVRCRLGRGKSIRRGRRSRTARRRHFS